VDELVTGQPKQLLHATTVQDGYMETKAVKSVWAVKAPNGEIKVFSPLCPHLGCGYRWDNDNQKFTCPCHGSVYSITGQVLAGPAPRPLDDLPEKIDNGRLLVIYKEFKSGLPKKVEI
jgi:quinol---cytochrome c reductase iron-sulfur subunit, bacillus type